MSTRPYAVDDSLSLPDAADRMRAHDIRHLIVLRDQRLVGVVSYADLAFEVGFSRGHAADLTLRDAMRPPFTCPPDAPLSQVAREMEARHLEAAVVVDDDQLFVLGIFTLTDALRALRQLAQRQLAPSASHQASTTGTAVPGSHAS